MSCIIISQTKSFSAIVVRRFMARKRFQDLKLTDAFLFAVVMQDEEVCHDTLELLLGQKVGKVHVVPTRRKCRKNW